MSEHWEPVVPYVYRRGALIERDSGDCGRWVNFDPSVDWVCEECSKYYKQKYEVTQDGITWIDTGLRRRGAIYEYDSSDCCIYRWYQIPIGEDYVCDDCGGPAPTGVKWIAQTNNGFVLSAVCDSSEITHTDFIDFGITTHIIKSVTIGDCVTEIGYRAFDDFAMLKSVGPVGSGASIEIPSGVTRIGIEAFMDCTSITGITVPDNVMNTNISLKGLPNLKNLTIEGGSELHAWSYPDTQLNYNLLNIKINSVALSGKFDVNNIESITFGERFGVFYDNPLTELNNTALTGITFENPTPPSFVWGYPFTTPITFPIFVPCDSIDAYKQRFSYDADKVTCMEHYRKRTISGTPYCDGIDKYVDVYEQESFDAGVTWKTASVSAQLVENFSTSCGLSKSSNVITYSAPSKLNIELTKFTPAATAHTFSNGIGVFEFASDVVSLNNGIFSGTNITSIYLPDSITEIGRKTFYNANSLKSIHIPSGITIIDESVFSNCMSLTGVTIPDSVTTIGEMAFERCISLTSINMPDGLTSIGVLAFQYCSGLTSCTIGSGVTDIGNVAFTHCLSLTSVTIPNSVTSIGSYAFEWCNSLTSITIPDSVTLIDDNAFEYCSMLTSMTVEATTPPTLGRNVFNNTHYFPIYVPDESFNLYKDRWSQYSEQIFPMSKKN